MTLKRLLLFIALATAACFAQRDACRANFTAVAPVMPTTGPVTFPLTPVDHTWCISPGGVLASEKTVIAPAIAQFLVATAALTAGQVVKVDSANANSVVVTATTDTGPGIAIGIVRFNAAAGADAAVVTLGRVPLAAGVTVGTGSCSIGNFVIVDTTTAGDVKCTATYTAGTVIGRALTNAATGASVGVLVHPQ